MKFTEEFFQELEEFRMTIGINDENHPLYKLLVDSYIILKNQEDIKKIKKIIEHGLAEDGFDDLPEEMCINIQKILEEKE